MNIYLIKTNFKSREIKVIAKCFHKNNTRFIRNNRIFLQLACNIPLQNKFLQSLKFNKNFSDIIKKDSLSDLDLKKDENELLKETDEIKQVTLSNFYSQMKDEQQKEESNLPTNINPAQNAVEEVFIPDRNLSTSENFALYRDHIKRKEYKEKQKTNYKKKVGLCLFIMFLGLFTLWIPLYKTICESQGFSVKTTHQDYKFDGRKCNPILFKF